MEDLELTIGIQKMQVSTTRTMLRIDAKILSVEMGKREGIPRDQPLPNLVLRRDRQDGIDQAPR